MAFLRRLWFLLTRRRRAGELREEMQLHVELRAAANRREGRAAGEADRAARRLFGNQLRLSEQSADEWGFVRVDRARQDLRHALRHLGRRPTWTTAIVLTLAIGIAANASVLAVINAILFAPVDGAQANRLVWVATRDLSSGRVSHVSYPDYTAFRARAATFAGLLAYSDSMFAIGSRPAARVYGAVVSGNYFDVLGVHTTLGRLLTVDDDRPGSPAAVVLSDALWRDHFAANLGVVNSVIAVNGRPFVVVGVAPPGFQGAEIGEDAELWVPLARLSEAVPETDPALLSKPDSDWLQVIGRLPAGMTRDAASGELAGIAASLRPAGGPSKRRTTVDVAPAIGDGPASHGGGAAVLGLLGIVPLLVLVVACANVGNVIMADNVARRREFAMRRAVGASRGRLVHQLLVEAAVLALAAAAVGLLLSNALTRMVGYLGDIPPTDLATVLGPNPRVLAATTALAMATVVIFALLPALTATKLDLASTLKDHGDRGATGRFRLRSAFVVVQVALSATLLVVAGLFLQSFGKALRVDPGFVARGAATFSFDPALQGYSADRQAALVRRLLDGTGAMPGVTAAAITSVLPLSGETRWKGVVCDGATSSVSALDVSVSPRYFETMSTPIVAGRAFTDNDGAGAPGVAIVNQALARILWPGRTPLGQRLRQDGAAVHWVDVVGVVADGKYADLTESPQPAFFVPLAQAPASPMTLVARTSGDTAALTRALSALAAGIDPDLPIYRAEPLDVSLRQASVRQQAIAALLGVLGALALLLAAIGLYGVAAHNATIRVREVGVRMALGAHAADVTRLFLGDGLRLAAVGVAIGLAISAAASRLLSSFLFGLTATDATTFVAGAGILCAVAAIASYVPARRAARLDPAHVLRQL